MYTYDEFDRTLVAERVSEFRDQVARRLSGALTEEEFKPLRLMNGVYLQLHAYMLRIAIPYGTLSSAQMHTLGHVARRYDRGYGHFTTRQNIQFNWIKLDELPDAMADLARSDGNRAVDVYLAPVKVERDRVLPGNLRELIRMQGPTIDLPITFGI